MQQLRVYDPYFAVCTADCRFSQVFSSYRFEAAPPHLPSLLVSTALQEVRLEGNLAQPPCTSAV